MYFWFLNYHADDDLRLEITYLYDFKRIVGGIKAACFQVNT